MAYRFEQKVGKYTYLYEITSYWDKERKKSRQRRTLIGKRDPVSGELVSSAAQPVSREYGPVYFLWHLLQRLGVEAPLRQAFPDEGREILLAACFQVAEERALYLCNSWLERIYLKEPCALSSSQLSGLLKRIGADDEAVSEFLASWAGSQVVGEFVVFDITSISSYSKSIDFVEWGYNRDGEQLAQVNLGVVYGEPHSLPLFYSLYPGSVPDVKTLANIVTKLSVFKVARVLFVLDKGFYSRANVEAMENAELTFVMPIPISNKLVVALLDRKGKELAATESLLRFEKQLLHYIEDELVLDGRRYRAYGFRNDQLRLQDQERLVTFLLDVEEFVTTAAERSPAAVVNDLEERFPGWTRYFRRSEEQGRLVLHRIGEAIDEHIERAGILVLMTNSTATAQQALSFYRKKDGVEKLFDAMKHGIDGKRLRVHSRAAAEGMLFLNFLSLILYSSIQRTLRDSGLSKRYTVHEVFYELKKLSVMQYGTRAPMVTEVTRKHREIFKAFDIPTPTAQP